LQEVREVNSETVFLMVGNKCDLTEKREVDVAEALQYSKDAGIAFLETSAFTGNNCTKAMQLILQDIHAQQTKLLYSSLTLESKQPLLSSATIQLEPHIGTPRDNDDKEDATPETKKNECAC